MNLIQQLHLDYKNLNKGPLTQQLQGWQPLDLEPVELKIDTDILEARSLLEKLSSLADICGWLLYPDELVVVPEQRLPSSGPVLPLSGELKTGDDHIHLSYLGLSDQGAEKWQWCCSRIIWDTTEPTHLLELVKQEAYNADLEALCYWRAWGLNAKQQLSPCTALFDGFIRGGAY